MALLVLAVQPAAARDQNLRGARISLFGAPLQCVSAAEPSFVRHGWIWPMQDDSLEPSWRSMGAAERNERRDDAVWRFELDVDGVPIALDRSFHATSGPEPQMAKFHFVQFEANQLTPGNYLFEGRWYGDSDDDDASTLELYLAVDVEVVPGACPA